jgi:hypothetical protein
MTDLRPNTFDPETHWKLTGRIDSDFERFVERFLDKTPLHQRCEALRLIADACYARMERLEDQNRLTPNPETAHEG